MFLDGSVLRWRHGAEPMDAEIAASMRSPDAADGSEPLVGVDAPYARERCDIAGEVAKAQGKSVEGLSIGETCFNLCFPGGRELDARIFLASDGRPLLRVFWEQW